MKLSLIGPGIMPIPPDGWGAVESLIWDYALELEELGHEGTIVNTQNWDEIINYLNEEQYDFVHLHYDAFYQIMDRISQETNIPKLAISSHYPYIDQPHMHQRDGYDRIFNWIIDNKKYYVFCISKKDYQTFKEAGADESRLILSENGANHKRFTYCKESVKPNRSLYLGQIYHRKKQWIYQSIDSIDFVGQDTKTTPFDTSINYLGEWTDDYKREHFTDYGNLVLLSDGENGTPLVVKEALINGLGVVISKYAAHDLPEGLPFVTVIPDDKLEDISYVEEKISENREMSIGMRDDIRQFAIDNFSWESLVKLYAQNIEKLESNAN
jgi:glycosyltransferase involved in cell wall biosynthesis